MTDITSSILVEKVGKVGHTRTHFEITVPDTAVSADTFTLDLTQHGCTKLRKIAGWVATTEGSVIAAEAPTTAVNGTTKVLTVTIGGSAVTKSRYYELAVE